MSRFLLPDETAAVAVVEDQVYDFNKIGADLKEAELKAVIPPKRNRKASRKMIAKSTSDGKHWNA